MELTLRMMNPPAFVSLAIRIFAIGLLFPASLSFATTASAATLQEKVEVQDTGENDDESVEGDDVESDDEAVGDEAVGDEREEVPINIHLTNLTELVGQKIDLMMTDGDFEGNVIVTQIKEGKVETGIQTLKVREPDSNKQHGVSVSRIEEIYINEYPLDVTYDRKNRSLVHDPEKRETRLAELKVIADRLALSRDRLWQPLMPEEHEAFIASHRDFLTQVEKTMPDISFRLVETEFYLFFTNLSPAEVDGYIVYLDAMYKRLCAAFGIPSSRNIWCGKCVVIAFRDQENYLRFEQLVMEVDATGSQGMCHSFPDGKVVFAGFKGDSGFGHVLVHETSHGFVHRYFSTARAPSWLNEGMADWLAHEIVKGDRIPRRRLDSARLIQQRNSWGDLLVTERIDGEMYGAASTLVEILLQKDQGGQFKQFFDDLKKGKDSEEALKDAFGISYNDLQILYAEAISGR